MNDTKTVYELIGGEPALQAAVDLFYDKMLADERVRHFFDDIDMEQQKAKQRRFLKMVTGGSKAYPGKSMREGHAHLLERGLDDSHVDVVVAHLGDTLAELGVPAELVEQVKAAAESARDDVLSRPANMA
jgi:hemoglobin